MLPEDEINNVKKELGLNAEGQKAVSPLNDQTQDQDNDSAAANVVRQKIGRLYADEPDAQTEIAEAESTTHRSKHQQYMYDLSTSGRSLAEIEAAWHKYYQDLPDHEKHEVWKEYNQNYGQVQEHSGPRVVQPETNHAAADTPSTNNSVSKKPVDRFKSAMDNRSVAEIKQRLLGTVSKRAQKTQKRAQHRKSLFFGVSMGLLTLVIMSFGFFNERFIAPFITPSRTVSSTPIIIDASEAVSKEPKVIIPKINVEVPVVYDEPSVAEDNIQKALERGVVHYATTPKPGELGNSVIFGHSSNNILNSGKYKFAFVLLNRLDKSDTFMLNYEGTRYVYRVVEKKIVKPTDLSVLEKTSRPATATLITCDPPGTAVNRLIVIGEQIAPNPDNNVASSVDQSDAREPEILPSNAPSLWSRIWD